MSKKKELKYKTWNEVEDAISELAALRVQMTKAKAQVDRQLIEIRAAFADRMKEPEEQAKTILEDIRAFAKANRKDFGDKKSREFGCGTIKFFASGSIVIPKGTEADIIKALKGRNMLDCIMVDEKINRDVLKIYSKDAIEAVGAKLKLSESCKVVTLDEGGNKIEG
ncbi:MAG: host-nuclease inhibitor Gam family protein [Clostridia bacterium]|nr:host-nuclease inhibitor Gam family protein [Clostridia bacterium]